MNEITKEMVQRLCWLRGIKGLDMKEVEEDTGVPLKVIRMIFKDLGVKKRIYNMKTPRIAVKMYNDYLAK